MKNILKLLLLIIFFFNCIAFSQEKENIFFDSSEAFDKLFVYVKINSTGDLCIKMKQSGGGFLLEVDSLRSIVSEPNKVYCVKDSIRLIRKGGWSLKISNDKDTHWSVKKESRNFNNGNLKKLNGSFKKGNDTTLKHLNKEEYNSRYKNH